MTLEAFLISWVVWSILLSVPVGRLLRLARRAQTWTPEASPDAEALATLRDLARRP
ncbi:MAG: hypothetical protein LC798_16975 [Chloroflexi bacterium]|nr:hypothetical protein [Chloroflexota bacterium]